MVHLVIFDLVADAIGSAVCQIALIKAWRSWRHWICRWTKHRWQYFDAHEPSLPTKTFRQCMRCGCFNPVGEFDAGELAAFGADDLERMGAQILNNRLQPRRTNHVDS